MKKLIIFVLMFVLLVFPVSASSDISWTLLQSNTKMSVGSSLQGDGYTATLSDYSVDWDGNIEAVFFNVYADNTFVDSVVVSVGGSSTFADDNYKITCTLLKTGKFKCCLYKVKNPSWDIDISTIMKDSGNYTTITLTLQDLPAKYVHVSYILDESITAKSIPKNASYGSVALGKTITSKINCWEGSGNISILVEYKNTAGDSLSNTYDVIKLSSWNDERSNSEEATKKRITQEKKYFVQSIKEAMIYADLNDSQKTTLKSFTSLRKNLSTKEVNIARVRYERSKLIIAINRAEKYLSLSESDIAKLEQIKEQLEGSL